MKITEKDVVRFASLPLIVISAFIGTMFAATEEIALTICSIPFAIGASIKETYK